MDFGGVHRSQLMNFAPQNQFNMEGTGSGLDLTLRLGLSSNNHGGDHFRPYLNEALPRASNQFWFNYTNPAVGTTSKAYNVPKPPKPDDYCDIDITNKTSRTGGSRKRNLTKVRTVKPDENLICTNFNCRVTKSPMWRKGPLGPKSLCNRCGIRYRKMKMKEEMEKKEREQLR
ncbi:GATA transcription factor 8-like [Pyrus ussuriensis x Pyrus communis]|uniref:GATA transcription factor 8-like n=1 Tax=Pyrus ussuriensis x Pyrus communis TaxID=2448454 RepID=A0A5N5FWE6_9ROSA|nr:GATA transcription factor 8-like [Pyrus ussuriensis x Pyrus communis]